MTRNNDHKRVQFICFNTFSLFMQRCRTPTKNPYMIIRATQKHIPCIITDPNETIFNEILSFLHFPTIVYKTMRMQRHALILIMSNVSWIWVYLCPFLQIRWHLILFLLRSFSEHIHAVVVSFRTNQNETNNMTFATRHIKMLIYKHPPQITQTELYSQTKRISSFH